MSHRGARVIAGVAGIVLPAGRAVLDSSSRLVSYTVVQGDALEVIAARFGLRSAADFLMAVRSDRQNDRDPTLPVFIGETFTVTGSP